MRVDGDLNRLLGDVARALDGAVALVSGRALIALDGLFSPRRWPAAGLHGLERRDAAGGLHRHAPAADRLAEVRAEIASLAARHAGVLIEDKGLTVAVHYRAAPGAGPALRRAIGALAARLAPDYHGIEGRYVFELKPSCATKADAVRAFMQEAPFRGRRPIYIGDDVTDIDGFAAVEHLGGLSVAVGDRVRARQRVASPREVRVLLAGLAADGDDPP